MMANISKTLEQDLIDIGYIRYAFINHNDFNDNNPLNADELTVFDIDENSVVKMHTIKLPKKKLVDIAFVNEKLNKESTYKNFVESFNKILHIRGYKNCVDVYPTSYGIGVFIHLSSRMDTTVIKSDIDSILVDSGIKFRNERSDAGWVFRYIISKSNDNILKLGNV